MRLRSRSRRRATASEAALRAAQLHIAELTADRVELSARLAEVEAALLQARQEAGAVALALRIVDETAGRIEADARREAEAVLADAATRATAIVTEAREAAATWLRSADAAVAERRAVLEELERHISQTRAEIVRIAGVLGPLAMEPAARPPAPERALVPWSSEQLDVFETELVEPQPQG